MFPSSFPSFLIPNPRKLEFEKEVAAMATEPQVISFPLAPPLQVLLEGSFTEPAR
jgi:hypothetical protein